MTVDSTPTAQGPPSKIIGIRPSMSSIICWAAVGDGRPERLPLGAAIGSPLSRMSAWATGFDGKRMPTVERPAEVTSGIRADFGRTIVIGPGQKASASLKASSGGFSTRPGSISIEAMWTISGLSWGRPLARKIFSTASGFRASPARP